MLQNGYLLAKIGADTAENEQHFAEILPIGRRVAAASGAKSEEPDAGRAARWLAEAELRDASRPGEHPRRRPRSAFRSIAPWAAHWGLEQPFSMKRASDSPFKKEKKNHCFLSRIND